MGFSAFCYIFFLPFFLWTRYYSRKRLHVLIGERKRNVSNVLHCVPFFFCSDTKCAVNKSMPLFMRFAEGVKQRSRCVRHVHIACVYILSSFASACTWCVCLFREMVAQVYDILHSLFLFCFGRCCSVPRFFHKWEQAGISVFQLVSFLFLFFSCFLFSVFGFTMMHLHG